MCPPTVETNLRKNALVFQHKPDENSVSEANDVPREINEFLSMKAAALPEDGAPAPKKGLTLTIEQAVDYVVMAIDTKMRKVIFPTKAWYSSYIRPIIPDYVDTRLL